MNFLQQSLWLASTATSDRSGLWGSIKNGIEWFINSIIEFTGTFLSEPNVIVGIFIFTIIVKLALQPLMSKQMRSMRKMTKLQPQIQELQKRYSTNPQKQQQEIMRLYKEYGASPFAGCLPLLIQMPIIIALFQTLRELPIANETSFMWIPNLAEPDPTGWLLPLIAAAATMFQQFITTSNRQDKTQRMMLFMMPVMFFIFVRSFPSLLAFYWIFYSIIGAAIQYVLNKKWAKEDAAEEAQIQAKREAELLEKKAKKAEKKGISVEELLEEEDDENTVEVDGIEYILPHNYSLREKKVKAHPYSEEEETITMVVLPDGKEKPLSILKRKTPAIEVPNIKDLLLGAGKKNKKSDNGDK